MRENYDRQSVSTSDEALIHNRISAILKRAGSFSYPVVQPLPILPYNEFLHKYPTEGSSIEGIDQRYTRVRGGQGLGTKDSKNRLTSNTTKNEFLLRLLSDAGSNQFIYLEPRAITLKDNNTLMVVNHAEGQSLDEIPEDLRNVCMRSLAQTVAELHRLGITHNDIKASDFFWSRSPLNNRLINIELIDLGNGRYSYFKENSLEHPALQELVAIKNVVDIENAWDKTVLSAEISDPKLQHHTQFSIVIGQALEALDILSSGKGNFYNDKLQVVTLDYIGGSPTLPLPDRDFDVGKFLVQLGFTADIDKIKGLGVGKKKDIIPLSQNMKKHLEDINLRHHLSLNRKYVEKLWRSFFHSHGLVLDENGTPVGYEGVDARLGFPKPEDVSPGYDQRQFSTYMKEAFTSLIKGTNPKNVLMNSTFPEGVSKLVSYVQSAPEYMYNSRIKDLGVLLNVILKDILNRRSTNRDENDDLIRTVVRDHNKVNTKFPEKIITKPEWEALLELDPVNEKDDTLADKKRRYELSLSALRKL